MKSMLATLAMAALIASTGCDKGTSGGNVKEKDKDKKGTLEKLKDSVIQPEGTYSLKVPSVKLKQGEEKSVTITIKRGKNVDQDVALKFEGMPEGVTIDPAAPTLKKSETDLKVTVKATDKAALGVHTVTVMGHPEKGEKEKDSKNEMKVTVEKK